MESYLIRNLEVAEGSLVVEGWHQPGSLTRASGVWLSNAGNLMLEAGSYTIKAHPQWVWFAVEEGHVTMTWDGRTMELNPDDTCILPAGETEAEVSCESLARCQWMAIDGPLASMFVRKMGALPDLPLRQTALPSQIYLGQQIAQVMVRHSGTSQATYQLQHLMYGMLASHWGQPVAMDAMLSHEIAKVMDALRANEYRDNLSLSEMAAISRMPVETFRKRFVAEVGMPPLSYVLRCKMERAKQLLLEGECSVRDVGVQIGMKDPYHFSKQFRNIVGVSPMAFIKQASTAEAPVRRPRRIRKAAKE